LEKVTAEALGVDARVNSRINWDGGKKEEVEEGGSGNSRGAGLKLRKWNG
jgi:hypothetical protein